MKSGTWNGIAAAVAAGRDRRQFARLDVELQRRHRLRLAHQRRRALRRPGQARRRRARREQVAEAADRNQKKTKPKREKIKRLLSLVSRLPGVTNHRADFFFSSPSPAMPIDTQNENRIDNLKDTRKDSRRDNRKNTR